MSFMQDKIYKDFLDCLNFQLEKIPQHVIKDSELISAFWLCLVPRFFFELLFINKKKELSKPLVPILESRIENNGKECAFITQAFVLSQLEQILKNDKEYKTTIGLSIEHFEVLSHDSLIGKNSIMRYLNKYRRVISSNKLDFRDSYVIYVWDICDALVPKRDKCMKIIGEWDDDTLGKMAIISEVSRFFATVKESSLKVLKTDHV